METNNPSQEIDQELKEASIELNQASQRYHNAILARIALRTLVNQENK